MPKVDLGSARAKLRWARERRNDLETRIDTTLENPEYWAILSADLDPGSGEHVFRVTDVPDYNVLVEVVSLYVGDVVHALRGALDHLAWQLATAHGSMGDADARRIQFPIHEDLAKFRSNGTARFYHPDHWTQIEEYQPFKGLNGRSDSYSAAYIHQLAHLQELSNTDKHRQLSIVLLTSSRFTTVPVEGRYPPWLVKEDGKWTMDITKVNEPTRMPLRRTFSTAPTWSR